MRRSLCFLSGISLVLFIFSLSPDVYAVKGFTTELMGSHTSRTYGLSSTTEAVTPGDTKDDSGSKEAKPDGEKSSDVADGGAPSKLLNPPDDGLGGEIVTLTITPHANSVTGAPGQISGLTPVENHILTFLTATAPLSVQQQDDQGHISLSGTLALWLSNFLHENSNPVESLNANRGRLYIPEFFGANLATYTDSLPAPEAGAGTLIWIEITVPSGGAAPCVNQQMTIHYFTNIDGQVQMDLFMGHINAITGQAVLATAVFSDQIETGDRLQHQRSLKMVRLDSVTKADVVIGGVAGLNQGSSKGDKSGNSGMSAIPEGSRGGQQDSLAILVGFEVLNKTITEEGIRRLYETKMPFDEYDWAQSFDYYPESIEIMK